MEQNLEDILKRDTDGDSLTDGEEVNKHRTDPLKADTDNGIIDDGTELDAVLILWILQMTFRNRR